MNAAAHISDWIRTPYVIVVEFLDRWYEEMPWRRELALGPRGEAIARRYLRRRGYLILARNFRSANAENDIVALDGETLVFVEVKAREGIEAGSPREAVDDHKQERGGELRRDAPCAGRRDPLRRRSDYRKRSAPHGRTYKGCFLNARYQTDSRTD